MSHKKEEDEGKEKSREMEMQILNVLSLKKLNMS